jgi:hypothetical protein
MGTTKSMHDWLALLQTNKTSDPPDSTTTDGATTSASGVTVAGLLRQSTEVVCVAYQKISYDWAIADGTYTPQQLRKAKVAVKAWGPVQTCSLTVERDPAC